MQYNFVSPYNLWKAQHFKSLRSLLKSKRDFLFLLKNNSYPKTRQGRKGTVTEKKNQAKIKTQQNKKISVQYLKLTYDLALKNLDIPSVSLTLSSTTHITRLIGSGLLHSILASVLGRWSIVLASSISWSLYWSAFINGISLETLTLPHGAKP